ncbi:MAG TPA: STAS domain-containing protein [Solirubrobacteraceae bacterium]|nr:STAS domain-containing protein [Solirubrobacteraceae bacterium]
MSGPVFEVEETLDGERRVLTLVGELDLASVPVLVRAVEDLPPHATIALDLSGLSFIDSSGIHALIEACERCRQRRQEIRLIPGPKHIQTLFELTGVLRDLPFELAGDGYDPGEQSLLPRLFREPQRR